jgi:hypothetical protein
MIVIPAKQSTQQILTCNPRNQFNSFFQLDNGIPIESWSVDQSDRELFNSFFQLDNGAYRELV